MQAKVKITGSSPLLMHRYPLEDDTKTKKKDQVYDSKTDAEKATYKDERGYYMPSLCVEGAMREAAKRFPLKGKSTYKETIQTCVRIEEENLYLENKEYEIDRRPVVIQRARVVRSRPKFNSWKLEFTLNFDEDRITSDRLKEILEEAGNNKGIGDFRPKFGRFKVSEFTKV